ncbi:MAG: DUF4168 domain-containing protein [Desulfovibrionales bacterium]
MNVFTPSISKFMAGIFFLAALLVVSLPAMAQSQYGAGEQGENPGLEQSQPAPQLDDQTLTNFAAATIELGNIQNEFAKELQSVQDREKAMEIQQEMQQQMITALEDEGLDVETYNAIANQMNVDEDLRNSVTEKIQEQQK